MKYISMLSWGRDSTAMMLHLLENGDPLDYIVFCDTGMEHAAMYDYIDKLDALFQRKYNIGVTRLSPATSFDDYVWGIRTKGEHEGKRRGTPAVTDPCFWRRESKQAPFDRWLKNEFGIGTNEDERQDEIVQYAGFVFGESGRVEAMPKYSRAPLYEWRCTEIDVQRYLEENEIENPLYRDFSRTGCATCPKQSIADKYTLWDKYPDVWAYMAKTERELNADDLRTGQYPRWHVEYFIEDMERMFKRKKAQATFEFKGEPMRDCFCKI